MDYASLIQRAWSLTWHHKFLWLFALFAGSSGGTCAGGGPPSSSGGGGGGDFDFDDVRRQLEPGTQQVLNEATRWLSQNLGIILAVAAGVVLLVLALLVISLICQGALARASLELAQGRPMSFGLALQAGLRLFWRYAGFSLVMLLFGLGAFLVVAALGVFGWLAWQGSGGSIGPLLAVMGALGGLLFLLVAIPFFIILGIVVAYAQRAMADDDVGPIAALGLGWRLLWSNKGSSAMAWFMSLVLTIGVGLAVAFAVMVMLIPLGIAGAMVYASGGLNAASIGVIILVALLVLLVVIALGSAANTLLWNFWTLVYLQLRGRLGPKLLPLATE